jgi:hypothetical protein
VSGDSSAAESAQAARTDFVQRALVAATEWNRFADTKALGIVVLLGLGLADLLDQTDRLHPGRGGLELLATCLFSLAGLAAAVTVFCVRETVLPRVKPLRKGKGRSSSSPRSPRTG